MQYAHEGMMICHGPRERITYRQNDKTHNQATPDGVQKPTRFRSPCVLHMWPTPVDASIQAPAPPTTRPASETTQQAAPAPAHPSHHARKAAHRPHSLFCNAATSVCLACPRPSRAPRYRALWRHNGCVAQFKSHTSRDPWSCCSKGVRPRLAIELCVLPPECCLGAGLRIFGSS